MPLVKSISMVRIIFKITSSLSMTLTKKKKNIQFIKIMIVKRKTKCISTYKINSHLISYQISSSLLQGYHLEAIVKRVIMMKYCKNCYWKTLNHRLKRSQNRKRLSNQREFHHFMKEYKWTVK